MNNDVRVGRKGNFGATENTQFPVPCRLLWVGPIFGILLCIIYCLGGGGGNLFCVLFNTGTLPPPTLPVGSVASAFRSKLGLTRFTWCPFYTGPWFRLQVQPAYVAVTLSSLTFFSRTFSRRGKTEHHHRFLNIMPYTRHHIQHELNVR